MKNNIVVRQYQLPREPGIFSLPLPYATNPGDFLSLGVIQLNGQAHLLVREDAEKKRPDERTFALVESDQLIPTDELPPGLIVAKIEPFADGRKGLNRQSFPAERGEGIKGKKKCVEIRYAIIDQFSKPDGQSGQ